MAFRPIQRKCAVCGADLTARKETAGWRLPRQVAVNFTVEGHHGGRSTRPLHFCPGCVNGHTLSVAVDSLIEKGFLR